MMVDHGYQINKMIHESGDFKFFTASGKVDGASFLIKVSTSRHPDPQVLQQLDHEFALADLLDPAWALHPDHRVRLTGGEALVFDNFDGQPLHVSEFPLDIDAFLDCAIMIVSVVTAMHEAGIIHKDLKPANILMSTEGDVRLTGFGIATRKWRSCHSVTRTRPN